MQALAPGRWRPSVRHCLTDKFISSRDLVAIRHLSKDSREQYSAEDGAADGNTSVLGSTYSTSRIPQ